MEHFKIGRLVRVAPHLLSLFAILMGVLSGMYGDSTIFGLADTIADVTLKIMKLIGIPVLFFSIISSAGHFQNLKDIRKVGGKILRYTLLTTLLAAVVAEGIYLAMEVWLFAIPSNQAEFETPFDKSFSRALLEMVPANIVAAFLENNVIAIVGIAIALSFSFLTLEKQHRTTMFSFFTAFSEALMVIVRQVVKVLPISVWAFVTLLAKEFRAEQTPFVGSLGAYTLSVISANLVQGLFIIPLLLLLKGINPLKLFMEVNKALFMAFFTRSSAATLPVTLERAINQARINPTIARLSLPLCTTINMNGCAQFILITVYFVAGHNHMPLGPLDHVMMIFLATVAAIGNAGVPMGCFFLASTLLSSQNLPLHLMGLILPIYTLLDMVETALNVWSDVAVTKMVAEDSTAEVAAYQPEMIG